MNGRARMRVVERSGDGTEERDDAKWLITLPVAEHLVQRVAGDELGDEIRRFAVIRELVDARYRLMLEGRVGAQLEHEAPREADVARHAGPDGPNCDAAVPARMLGLIKKAQAVGVPLAQQAIGADVVVTGALRP